MASVDYIIDWYLWACWSLLLILGILRICLCMLTSSRSNPLLLNFITVIYLMSVHDGLAAGHSHLPCLATLLAAAV